MANPGRIPARRLASVRIEIQQLLANPKSPGAEKAALRAEREELEQLRADDPELFELGRWRGGKLSPAERLDQILTG